MKHDLSLRPTPRWAAPALAACVVLAFAAPASADGWGHGGGNVAGAVAAGIIGGAAIGALAAGAAAPPPPPAVVYPAQPVYAPGPVYAAPPPVYPAPGCWIQRQRVWDGYGWVWRRVRVCN